MKYRSDFVTNSSSSSFIIAFKNNEDAENQFEKMSEKYPYYARIVFHDIANNKKTYTEVLKYLKERLEWEAKYYIRFEMPEYEEKRFDREWLHSKEFEDIVYNYVDSELKRFKDSVNHRGKFAIISYSDHQDSELEHDIMPYMPFTYKTFSNH